MRDTDRVADATRYSLTDQGRKAIDEAELCLCDIRLVGRQVLCRNCETLYGYVSTRSSLSYWDGRPRD